MFGEVFWNLNGYFSNDFNVGKGILFYFLKSLYKMY